MSGALDRLEELVAPKLNDETKEFDDIESILRGVLTEAWSIL